MLRFTNIPWAVHVATFPNDKIPESSGIGIVEKLDAKEDRKSYIPIANSRR